MGTTSSDFVPTPNASTHPTTLDPCWQCPQIEALLCQQPLDAQRVQLLVNHLLRPCRRCWRRLSEAALRCSALDHLADDPMLWTCLDAGLARQRPTAQRQLLLRPIHRRDAVATSQRGGQGRAAWCRLLLHNALAAGQARGRRNGLLPMATAQRWLAGPLRAGLDEPVVADLEALAAIYNAALTMRGAGDLHEAETYLLQAEGLLERGEGGEEPSVSWFEQRAAWHVQRHAHQVSNPQNRVPRRPEVRPAGTTVWCLKDAVAGTAAPGAWHLISAPPPSPPDDPLIAAIGSIQQALRRLEVAGNDTRRAELLYDLACIEGLRGYPDSARSTLCRADVLLSRAADAHPRLHGVVLVALAQVQALSATGSSSDGAALIDRARRLGGLDACELAAARRHLEPLLKMAQG